MESLCSIASCLSIADGQIIKYAVRDFDDFSRFHHHQVRLRTQLYPTEDMLLTLAPPGAGNDVMSVSAAYGSC